jgi:hypothetical protein
MKWRKMPNINTGNRMASLLHTQFRLRNITLNYPLFLMNCVASPMCSCGLTNETEHHFLFECNRIAVERCVFFLPLNNCSVLYGYTLRFQWCLYGHPDVILSMNVKLHFHLCRTLLLILNVFVKTYKCKYT